MMTTLSRWFRGSRTPSPRAAGRKKTCRLTLEALEDRCVPAVAADWLDPTFGGGAGYVTTPSITLPSTEAAIRADGKIVAIYGVSGDFGVVSYNADGSLDTGFSGDGKVATDFNGATDNARAVAVDGNKTLVVGTAQKGGNGPNKSYTNLALARYNVDGSLDTTFGSGGKVQTSLGNVNVNVSDVAIANGKIVVLGSVSGQGPVALRYNSNGSLDTSFGSGGQVVLSTGPAETTSLAIQADDEIVIAGFDRWTGFQALRLNSNGSLDTTFGTGGKVTTLIVGADGRVQTSATPEDVAIQADGKIVLAGHGLLQLIIGPDGGTEGRGEDVFLVRYNADGSLDGTFGNGGIVTADFNNQNGSVNQIAFTMALQGNGKIVTTGTANFTGAAVGADSNTLLMRFNVDGSTDASFGTGGHLEIPIGTNGDAGNTIGSQTDGNIVIAGVSGITGTNGSGPLTVSRFLSDGPALQATPNLFVSFPSPVTAGTAFSVTVTVKDNSGNTITDYTGTVHFTSSALGILPPDYTFTGAGVGNDNGVHTFSVTLNTAGGQSLTVTAPDAARVRPITVNPGVATHLAISGPTSIKANTTFSITVTAYDAYGNVATGYRGTVHFSSTDGGATLPANYTFTASDNGVHNFTGLKMKNKGTQTITVVEVVGVPPLLDTDDIWTINVT